MTEPSRVSFPGTQETPSEAYLDSWKAIAAYVKRDVSTVQRWEKREGMPVHRHQHDKRGSVYAVRSEVDAWFESRKLRLKGEDQTQEAEPMVPTEAEPAPGTASARHWLVLAAVTAIAVMVTGYFLTRNRTVVATGPKIKSLAVLPLKNLSGDTGQQYFVDGLTDELTTDLEKLGNLRVISRSSAVRYADTNKSLSQIAKDLNVDALLTGTVERSGNRVRIHTELVLPAMNEVLWAERYDRDIGDVFHLESEVSQSIAREVGIKLSPQIEHRLEHKPTSNPEAREAYLRALYFLDKDEDDKEGATKCEQYFQEAITKDPGYAAAHAGLSRCYQHFDLYSDGGSAAKATDALMKALQLDDELADAHVELGNYDLGQLWEYRAAEREYKRAIELDPNLSVAHSSYGFLLIDLGRSLQGIEEMRRARELDPLSLDVAENTGIRLLYARRYDEGLAQFRSLLEMNPNYTRARWMLARTYELKGMYKDAISECLKIPAQTNIDAITKAHFKRRCSL